MLLTVTPCPCSHQRTPACAWDLRNMSYPVYQGRLDHAAEPLQHTGLPQAVWHTNSKALFLSCHDDYMLGQADNGTPPPPSPPRSSRTCPYRVRSWLLSRVLPVFLLMRNLLSVSPPQLHRL